MSNNETLAQKIALLLEAEKSEPTLASLFASIEKMSRRLDKLERKLSAVPNEESLTKPEHPSLDKFAVAEAIADEVFGKLQKEKTCTFEPNGKPCDHCSMCSSRGF
jgi:hypothetical protein